MLLQFMHENDSDADLAGVVCFVRHVRHGTGRVHSGGGGGVCWSTGLSFSASGGKAKFLLARSLACTSQREKRALGLAVAVGCLSPIAPARTVEALADFSSTNRDNHILTTMVLSGSVAHLAGVNACCMRIAGSACCNPKSRDTAVRIWLAH